MFTWTRCSICCAPDSFKLSVGWWREMNWSKKRQSVGVAFFDCGVLDLSGTGLFSSVDSSVFNDSYSQATSFPKFDSLSPPLLWDSLKSKTLRGLDSRALVVDAYNISNLSCQTCAMMPSLRFGLSGVMVRVSKRSLFLPSTLWLRAQLRCHCTDWPW